MYTMTRQPTNIRLTAEAREIIARCSAKLGVSGSAVVEMAIRKFAGECGGKERSTLKPENL